MVVFIEKREEVIIDRGTIYVDPVIKHKNSMNVLLSLSLTIRLLPRLVWEIYI